MSAVQACNPYSVHTQWDELNEEYANGKKDMMFKKGTIQEI